MARSEKIGDCETCGKSIHEGDLRYLTADGCDLCEDHSPTLADAVRQQEEVLAERDETSLAIMGYDTFDEMAARVTEWKAEIATTGNRSLAY